MRAKCTRAENRRPPREAERFGAVLRRTPEGRNPPQKAAASAGTPLAPPAQAHQDVDPVIDDELYCVDEIPADDR